MLELFLDKKQLATMTVHNFLFCGQIEVWCHCAYTETYTKNCAHQPYLVTCTITLDTAVMHWVDE